MSRPCQTQAQKEKEALEEFMRLLKLIPDSQRPQGIRYPLKSVVIIALMAMVAGADDTQSMERWGVRPTLPKSLLKRVVTTFWR